MYAIIADGGRQFKVEPGQELDIDYRGAKTGDEVTFEEVLLFGDDSGTKVGTPSLEGASVVAEVVGTRQGPKLVIQKFKRRKNYRRRTGHRQLYNRVKITKIDVS